MKLKRVLSLCLALALLFGMMPWTAIPAEAATTLTLSQLKEKFPDGKYWNHYVNNTTEASDYLRLVSYSEAFGNSVSSTACALHGSADLSYFVGKYDCNYFDGGVQCCGFARKLGYDAYGTKVTTWSKKYTVSSVKPGDVIHYYGDGASASSGHWVFVTAVSGTTVTVGECNWGGNCIIRWGRSFNLSNVTSFTIYSAPYALSNGGTGVTYEVDDRYPTPFKANTLLWWNTSDGKTPVYDAVNGNQSGYIYNGYNNEDDSCTVEEVYTNGWCKITVPGLSGYRYCELSVFINIIENYNIWTVTASEWAQAYRRWDHGSPAGYIDSGDFVYILSETDTMFQVVYPTSSGNCCRWVDRCLLSHTYIATVTKATCTKQGYTTHTCSICGESYEDSYTNATGHSYGSWTTTKAATCTAVGTERRDCKSCDHYETREIAAKGHSYKSVVTAPTCTNKGYTTHTCSNCGNSYVDTYVAAKGHSYGEWTQTKAPGCTTKGAERRDCKNCDYYETREVAAKGHSYQSVVTAPTCTEQGYTTHTCANCGDVYVDSYVDALGHSYGEWHTTTEATCTENGEQRRDCANCDHYETEVIEAIGHDYKAVVTAPTCTEQGYTTHTCTNCGDVYVDSYVKALGHSYGEWYVVTDATCEKDGQKRHDCQNCDHYETAVIESGGHEYEAVVTEPTCSEQGYTTHICAHCGDSYVDSYVDAVDHDYQNGSCKYCGKLEVALGDANGDGKINTTDAKLVMQYELGMIGEDGLNLSAMDVNGDGKINTTDAKLIMQLELGMITEFPKP